MRHGKNYQKYLTAILYAIEVPVGVWAGFEFGATNYLFGAALTVLMMIIEVSAVVTWMNAQTIEIDEDLDRHEARDRKRTMRRR